MLRPFALSCLLFATLVACAADYSSAPAPTCLTAPPTCGPNAACVDGPAGPACACKAGFAGPRCDAVCAAGTQDNDGDGVCTASCAATPCGPHASCDDRTGTRVCACAEGYKDSAGGCVFAGLIRDPGFSGAPPDAWAATGMTLAPTEAGDVDPGVARAAPAENCAGTAQVAQTVAMPAATAASPLALRVVDRLTTKVGPFCSFFCLPIAAHTITLRDGDVFLGRFFDVTFGTTANQSTFQDRSLCLGERWFGRKLALTVGTSSICSTMAGSFERSLDRLAISEDPSCPVPGTVLNGDFEASGGWVPTGIVPGTSAEVVAGLGTGGSRAGRVQATAYCAAATLTGRISPPQSRLPNLAVAFEFKASANDDALVRLDGQSLARVRGNGAYRTAKVCVPEATKGLSAELGFTLAYRASPTNTCDGTTARELVVDDVRFVSDPSCAEPATLADPGFEGGDPVDAWTTTGTDGVARSTLRVPPGYQSAKAAALTTSKTCETTTLETLASVPRPAGKGVSLTAMVRGTITGTPKLTANLTTAPFALPSSNTFGRVAACVDRRWLGTTTNLAITLAQEPGGGNCGVAAASQIVLDDVRFEEDPACAP